MIPFFALIRKDLQLFLADPRAVLMSIVAPIVIASFFGYIFGGGAGSGDRARIPILVADLDGSVLTREVVARLAADPSLDVKPSTPGQAREAVRKGKATAAFVIPKNFTTGAAAAMFGGASKPQVDIFYDPSHDIEMKMLQGMLAGAIMSVAGKEIFGNGREMPSPFQIKTEEITSGAGVTYNGYAHSFGGMGVQFLLMVGVEVGVGLLLRRQQGIWKRMRAAPLSKAIVLGSRVTSSGITSMATLIILFTFARLVFGVHIRGSLAGFIGICAAFSLLTATFGLLIASIGKTAEATRGVAILSTLFLVMLGGAWVPTFVFPRWMQTLTAVIPTRWAVDGLDAVTWRGLGFSAVATPIALLLGCSVLFALIAVFRFRWEE